MSRIRRSTLAKTYARQYTRIADVSSREAQQLARRADLNGDGFVYGAREGRRLFHEVAKREPGWNMLTVEKTSVLQALLGQAQPLSRPATPRAAATTQAVGDSPERQVGRASAYRVNVGTRNSRYSHRLSGGGQVRLGELRDGHASVLSFTAKMAIDADGAPNVTRSRSEAKRTGKYYDPWYQPRTALQWRGHKALDADKIPFIVLPPGLRTESGAQLGDLVQVEYHGKKTYAIVGDIGPRTKLGEGSMALARSLGINHDPYRGGLTAKDVNYLVLPGTGHGYGIRYGSQPLSAADIQRIGADAFAKAKQSGVVA